MKKISVVLATRNEENNLGRCLEAVKKLADEIIVVDEFSTDKTQGIARSYGAKVFTEPHHENFHITKQKAIERATGEWILQLDADEVVTPELANEIKEVTKMSNEGIRRREIPEILLRHQRVLEKRDGSVGKQTGEVVAFFIPRKNIFLGKPLIHAGVYPDPAIRLIKKGKAHLPARSVHEIMEVDGEVAWLFNAMLHYDSPTLTRYLDRLNRYTDLHAKSLKESKVALGNLGLINYSFLKPARIFCKMYFVHAGFKDGMRGFVWCLFSCLHYPIAYFKYYSKEKL